VAGRTLVFVALTAMVVAVYGVGVGFLGERVFHNSALSVLLGAVVAALCQPVYGWARRGVDWLLYGDRSDPYRVVVRAGQAVQTEAGGQGLIEALAGSLRSALRLTSVRVVASGVPDVAADDPGGRRYELPLRYHGTQVGTLVVSRSGEVLTGGDRRLLAGVVPLLAAALDSMRRAAELRAVRERLVVVHEEERRRLRRELHDGLGPALAAVSLGLDAARALLRRDPEAGDAMLAGLQTELRASVGEMRRLIDELRPAALDQLGLVGAVRQHLARLWPDDENAGSVCVDGPDGGRGEPPPRSTAEPPHPSSAAVEAAPHGLAELPAAVEVAAYRIAVEAATNARRHAGGRRCRVTFTVDRAGQLLVTVRDDGRGQAGRPAGVGIRAMRERAEEIGGTLEIHDDPAGGCEVRAVLPTAPGAEGAVP
jgi:signal transduction histidine kinase